MGSVKPAFVRYQPGRPPWYPVAGGGGPCDIPDLPSWPFSPSSRGSQPGHSLKAELVLHFVEIGQGDCTLIECPNGGFILVDAGQGVGSGDRHDG